MLVYQRVCLIYQRVKNGEETYPLVMTNIAMEHGGLMGFNGIYPLVMSK